MEIAIIIWLWLSCYVMGMTMEANMKDKKISGMELVDHIAWVIIAPFLALPVAAYFVIRRIFSV